MKPIYKGAIKTAIETRKRAGYFYPAGFAERALAAVRNVDDDMEFIDRLAALMEQVERPRQNHYGLSVSIDA